MSAPAALEAIAGALRRARESCHDRAWTMPAAFYTDPAFLALERDTLFAREWLCVGRIEEVPEPGCHMAWRMGEEAIAIVHGQDGRIRALSNVCRHRGTLIVTGKGKARRLTCPYHHWVYDLDGRLAAAPQMPQRPDFDTAACRLPEFPCETWMGFIFVNLDSDAAPLAPRLADLEPRVAPYHLEEMWLGHLDEVVWETNWKSLIENYMEAYHLTPLHRTTLNNLNPTGLARHVPAGEHWFGYEVGFPEDAPRMTRGHHDLSDAQAATCLMLMVGPGTGIGLAADYSSFLCLQPEDTDRVRFRSGLLFWGDSWAQDAVDRAIELFDATMAEDRMVLEPLMTGYRSVHHAPGPLAPAHLEGPILDLAQYVARRMTPALEAALDRQRP